MNEKIVAKIKALRALATSSNVNEAAAAAAAATRLLLENDLEEADISSSEPEESPQRDSVPLEEYGGKITRWKSSLATFLIKQHGCIGWATKTNDGWKHVIVGRQSDIGTVRYMYAWLTTEIGRLAVKAGKGNGRAWFNSFYWGAVSGIQEQMTKAHTEVRAQASSTSLAIVDQRAIALRSFRPSNLKPMAKAASITNGDAYRSGQEAGRNLHVGRAIGSGGGAALMMGAGSGGAKR